MPLFVALIIIFGTLTLISFYFLVYPYVIAKNFSKIKLDA